MIPMELFVADSSGSVYAVDAVSRKQLRRSATLMRTAFVLMLAATIATPATAQPPDGASLFRVEAAFRAGVRGSCFPYR